MVKDIQLNDCKFFHGKLSAADDPPCQLNFYQLFVTREEMLIKTYVAEDLLFILGWSSESEHALYGPPLPLAGDPETLIHQLRKCYEILRSESVIKDPEEGLYIVLLNECWACCFEKIGAQIFPTRDDDNYLYRTGDVGNLTGNSLASRLAKIRAFDKKHGTLQASELNELRVSDARQVIRKWFENKMAVVSNDSSDHRRLLRDDFSSAMLTLEHLKDLPVQGEVYYLKDEPVGFVSGVPFHENTFLGLNFKSLRIRGLADVMFSSFARKLSARYEYLNTGQDLDLPSLRSFKKEWVPCRMLRTYRAYVPEEILL